MSKLFNIVRLRHPGKVNLYKFGTVDLFTLPDEKLLEIYKADPTIPYLQPTDEGLKVLHPELNIAIKQNPLLNPSSASSSSKQSPSSSASSSSKQSNKPTKRSTRKKKV